MAKRPIPSLDADFVNVLLYMKKRGVIPQSPPGTLIESAKRIHRATHSLILWRFRLKGIPEYGWAFIEEIASDALQILPQVLMGYSKTAKLLTRGIVENTLRHLFFSDHPIEFARMNRGSKWYVGMETLWEYLKIHPLFLDTEPKFDAVNRLSTLYDDLSASIHGRTVRHLEMRIALNRISYDEQAAQREAELVAKCAASANFLLAMFHREKMAAFQQEDRRIILSTMPPGARKAWSELM